MYKLSTGTVKPQNKEMPRLKTTSDTAIDTEKA